VTWENGEVGVSSSPDGPGYWNATIVLQGCTIEDSVLISVVDAPVLDIGNDTLLCNGDLLSISTTIPCTWNGGPQTNSVQIGQAGHYVASYSDGVCVVSDDIHVQFSAGPNVPWSGTYEYCQGEIGIFDASDSEADSIVWWNSDTSWVQQFDSSGEYFVSLYNECGSYTASFSILMNDCSDYAYFPNSFTPNQDGINDAWRPVLNNINHYEIEIFDRWGNVVFNSQNPDDYWMGENNQGEYFVSNGVYLYRSTIDFISGNVQVFEGHITIHR
jgi:gliding motility-associated-like protein